MAVISVIDISHGRTGSHNSDGIDSYQAIYRVITDDPLDGQQIVASASGLPTLNLSPYVFGNDVDLSVFCKSISPVLQSESSSNKTWLVTVTWETPQQENGVDEDGNPTDDPLKFRDDIQIQTQQVQRTVTNAVFRDMRKAKSGSLELGASFSGDMLTKYPSGSVGPIINSSLVPVTPAPTMEESHSILRWTRNVKEFPDLLWNEYRNKVNDELFLAVKKNLGIFWFSEIYNARVVSFGGSLQFHKDTSYWKVTVVIHDNPNSWRHFEPDMGYSVDPTKRDEAKAAASGGGIPQFVREPGSAPVDRLTDRFGVATAEPMLLDGSGDALDVDSSEIIYLEYSVYDELFFGRLQDFLEGKIDF